MSGQDVARSIHMATSTDTKPKKRKPILAIVQVVIQIILIFAVAVSIKVQLEESDRFEDEILSRHTQIIEELQYTQAAVRSSYDEDLIFLKILYLRHSLNKKLPLVREIASAVALNARAFDRDPDFILAIMSRESNFDPEAVSSAGALGLMQIMPHWLKIVGPEDDLTLPSVSVRRGMQIYAYYEKEFGNDMEKALTAYNRGSGPVWKDMANDREWRNGYSDKVLKTYSRLKRLSR